MTSTAFPAKRIRNVDVSSLQRDIAICDSGKYRGRFLAELVYWIGMAARGSYPSGTDGDVNAAEELRCLNEMLLTVAAQLRAAAGESTTGYPSDAFAATLVRQAALPTCPSRARWALEKSISAVPAD
jgi:hypothetical protein